MASLTPKQEKFAQEVACGKTQADAYRSAYDCKKAKPESVQAMASRIMADVKVASRVDELRKKSAEKVAITVEDLIGELEQARTLAMTRGKPQTSAMVAATVAKAKLLGLEAPSKVEVSGGFTLMLSNDDANL